MSFGKGNISRSSGWRAILLGTAVISTGVVVGRGQVSSPLLPAPSPFRSRLSLTPFSFSASSSSFFPPLRCCLPRPHSSSSSFPWFSSSFFSSNSISSSSFFLSYPLLISLVFFFLLPLLPLPLPSRITNGEEGGRRQHTCC